MNEFHVRGTPRTVEGWSQRRLPFEPQGSIVDYRAALRSAIGELRPAGGRLSCVYTSAVEASCDVENVMLYNVGLSAFAKLGVTELSVHRSFDQVAAPPVPFRVAPVHHHWYSIEPGPPTPGWPVIASWDRVELPARVTVEAVWNVMRGAVTPARFIKPGEETLSIELTVERPPQMRGPSLLSMTKALLDGALSALHAHDGVALDVVATRLASRLGQDPAVIAARLMDESRAVLGARLLVWPFREFVQWNPADDRLVDIHLRTCPATGTNGWRLSGSVRASV